MKQIKVGQRKQHPWKVQTSAEANKMQGSKRRKKNVAAISKEGEDEKRQLREQLERQNVKRKEKQKWVKQRIKHSQTVSY